MVQPGCRCCAGGFVCAESLVGYATNGVNTSGSITVDFSSIDIQAGDLINQFLVNVKSGATFLSLPSGWSFVTQVNYTNISNPINLHHSFKVADGSETSVTRTLSSGTADMASVVAVFRHPSGSFPVADGIADGTYGNGWYFKNYSSNPASDAFATHNAGPFLVQTIGEANMLHLYSWASGAGTTTDLFAGQSWLSDPEIIATATSPNFNAQLLTGFRCVAYPGEDLDSNLFMFNPISEDVGGIATYAGYQTAAPP